MSEARASGATVDRVYTPTVTRVKTVRVIPPTIQPLSDIPVFSVRPRRVAAYACVSTSSEEQLTSYEAQVKHYTEYIKSKEASDNWHFVDVSRYPTFLSFRRVPDAWRLMPVFPPAARSS